MSLTLVILAAGRGSRFGGNKPLASVGPSGQSLFEYSIYDAHKAGFKHVVFVVNAEQDVSEYTDRLEGYQNSINIEFAVQNLTAGVSNDVPNATIDTRSKPWGTAHAVLVCKRYINNPFVVINADDYYGRSNFSTIAEYLLKNSEDPKLCTLPGYKLENTLSNTGGVNRGVCSVDVNGFLTSIHEVKNIHLDAHSSLRSDDIKENIKITPAATVSMTFWGFHPSIFNLLENEFESFLRKTNDVINDEFVITEPINQAVRSNRINAKIFPTSETWKGVTYADDTNEVRNFIAELTDAGFYPPSRSDLC